MSIVIIINEKFRQKLTDIWNIFNNEEEKFQSIFKKILMLLISPLDLTDEESVVNLKMRRNLLIFLINCFQSLENAKVRIECMKIVSLPIWKNLTSSTRDEKFKIYPQFKKLWDRIEKKYKKSSKFFLFIYLFILFYFYFLIYISYKNYNIDNCNIFIKYVCLLI